MVVAGSLLGHPLVDLPTFEGRFVLAGLLLLTGIIISFDWLLRTWTQDQPWDGRTTRYATVAALTIGIALTAPLAATVPLLLCCCCGQLEGSR